MEGPTFTGQWKMVASTCRDKIAVSAGGGIYLTHLQLEKRVDEAAALLVSLGVRPGDVVALAFPNTVEFVVLFLAVIRCRATAAPVNPAYAAGEFKFHLSDSGSKLLLTPQEGNQLAQVAAFELNILHLTAKLHSADSQITLSSMDREPNLDLISEVVNDPSDVALFCHTPGTVSLLKRRQPTQLNLAEAVQLYKRNNKLMESDYNVIKHPLFYGEILVAELLSYLAAGATVFLPVDTKFDEILQKVSGPKKFSYEELLEKNGSFANSEILGRGASGVVYKGHIGDPRTEVAVKIIKSDSARGEEEFMSELITLGQIRHKNVVQLRGYCCEADKFVLIYQFMREGTLYDHLFKDRSVLTWERRYKIAQGLASVLHYMHEDYDQCVIHRDIKSGNILLDEEFNPKLGDFGLARMRDHSRGPQTTERIGTLGYAAREYCETGKAGKESDVYSFGVVLLEIGSGREAIDPERDPLLLVEWVWNQWGRGKLLNAMDSKLRKNFDKKQAEALMMAGLWCAHPTVSSRPSIKAAADFLSLKAKPGKLPKKMPRSPDGIDPKVPSGCLGF